MKQAKLGSAGLEPEEAEGGDEGGETAVGHDTRIRAQSSKVAGNSQASAVIPW